MVWDLQVHFFLHWKNLLCFFFAFSTISLLFETTGTTVSLLFSMSSWQFYYNRTSISRSWWASSKAIRKTLHTLVLATWSTDHGLELVFAHKTFKVRGPSVEVSMILPSSASSFGSVSTTTSFIPRLLGPKTVTFLPSGFFRALSSAPWTSSAWVR